MARRWLHGRGGRSSGRNRVRHGARATSDQSVLAPHASRGIATGHALLFEGDDYIGSAVNMASRLCDHATGYDVLMPASNTESLPEGISAEPYGDVELPGFPAQLRLSVSPVRPFAATATTPESSGPAHPLSDKSSD